jgi:hypothetical protein
MSAIKERNGLCRPATHPLARALVGAGLLLFAVGALAQSPGSAPTNIVLQSWSFFASTNWADDVGDAPASFTNLALSDLGDGASLVVDTNVPAWLNYYIYEPGGGSTNLVVNGQGSLAFWYAPNWATTNGGPGNWAQLIDVGEWTTNSSYGYWGLSVDPPGANLWFMSQDGTGSTYALSTPVSWSTNFFHFIALTYCATNTALYLDGVLATNDPGGLSIWPGSEVLSNGVFFGSDTNGQMQAHGLFNTVITYNYPLGSNDIWLNYQWELSFNNYLINPNNMAMNESIASASSAPSYTPQYDVITGSGNLQPDGMVSNCLDGTSAYNIWITNVVARISGTGSNDMSLTFTIEGGEPNVPYDVFANSTLVFGNTNMPWAWVGQGYQCNTYTLTNLPNTACFLILGTPQDTQGLGLTDAYEELVLGVSPSGPQADGYDVPYAWYAEHGVSIQSATQDPDVDGLLNYQEYQYGTQPKVSEGFGMWIVAGNNSSIP